MFLICRKCKKNKPKPKQKKPVRNTERTPGKVHVRTWLCGCPCRVTTLREKLGLCFSQTAQFTVTYCYHPQSWQEVTLREPGAAVSYCFPTETRQEVKLLQEALNRASHCCLLEIQSYNGPHSCCPSQAGNSPSVSTQLWVRTLNFHRRQLAQIQVNY